MLPKENKKIKYYWEDVGKQKIQSTIIGGVDLPKGHAETLRQWIVIFFLGGSDGVRFWIQVCSWMTFLCSAFSSFLSFCTFAIGAACVIALQPVSVVQKRVSLKNCNTKCLLRLSQLKWVSEWEEESICWKIWRVSRLWQLGIVMRKGHGS